MIEKQTNNDLNKGVLHKNIGSGQRQEPRSWGVYSTCHTFL
jgi:hypothetical protein